MQETKENKSPVQVCNHCGDSVSFGSGKFINRVLDFNDIETRILNKRIMPTGDFVCYECDSNLN